MNIGLDRFYIRIMEKTMGTTNQGLCFVFRYMLGGHARPVMVTIRGKDYHIKVLPYSCYIAITGEGPPKALVMRQIHGKVCYILKRASMNRSFNTEASYDHPAPK